MLKTFAMSALVLVAASLLVSSAAAQAKGAVEIGYDLGISVLMPDGGGNDVLFLATPRTVSVGISTVRAGFYLSRHSELEPHFGLQLISTNDFNTTQMAVGLDYLHNFDGKKTRLYLMGGARLAYFDNGSQTESQPGLGAGLGAKSTIGDRAALRYGVEVMRQFESGDFVARWDLGFLVGVSLFTK